MQGIKDSNTTYKGRLQFPRHVTQDPESCNTAKLPHIADDLWHRLANERKPVKERPTKVCSWGAILVLSNQRNAGCKDEKNGARVRWG